VIDRRLKPEMTLARSLPPCKAIHLGGLHDAVVVSGEEVIFPKTNHKSIVVISVFQVFFSGLVTVVFGFYLNFIVIFQEDGSPSPLSTYGLPVI
jgi:hypothetical protein